MDNQQIAPGAPGIEPRWTSSAKGGVGTAFNALSRVWFTLSFGVLDEIYYRRPDWACTRDMGLIVTDGKDFFEEEKRHTTSKLSYLSSGVPAYHLENTSNEGRYRIEKDIITDPIRDVVLQRTKFVPLKGKLEDYHVYVLLAPHLGNHGYGNTGWLDDYKGIPMLMAEREGEVLALGCSTPWLKRSVGYVGTSDGWQDLSQNKQMTWEYTRAENGNIALTAEVDLKASNGEFVLALAFDSHGYSAGHNTLASLQDGFDSALKQYIREWDQWQKGLLALEDVNAKDKSLYRTSAMVIQTHEAKQFAGGLIASLSIPWGTSKGDNDLGGYHLVWTRDLVEAVGGLMAAGAHGTARTVLHYLQITQEEDGHWSQNMWLDGTPYWTGVQLDESGFPILLTEQAWREGMLSRDELTRLWPMVRKAAGYIVRNGPVSAEDRWEEDAGYSPFTLAVEISALLSAAELADLENQHTVANYLRETADMWNDCIEDWTYAEGSDLAHQYGVDGYYVRIAPPDISEAGSLESGFVAIKNQPPGQSSAPAAHIISPDALALVRFGLRSPDDTRIVNTIKIIDAMLKVDTPFGPAWHRYNDDGYGEHPDGEPFDGTGCGRAWPLLTGERAHYELAAGHEAEARRLLEAMESFANDGGMIPEQIWDTKDIPDHGLYFGKPSGSAMPLVWAHSEHIKLRRSLREQRVFDMPPHPQKRYLEDKVKSPYDMWRFNNKSRTMHVGKILRIEVQAAARVHWTTDGWKTTQDVQTTDSTLGNYFVDLPTQKLQAGTKVTFTFYWLDSQHWENADFEIEVK